MANGFVQRWKGKFAAALIQMSGPLLQTAEAAITAHAGGTKAAARPLTAALNQISVCATTADSVLLPPSALLVGATVTVINDGAASMQIFGAGTDTIDAVATATGVPLAAASRADFFCVVAGKWQSAAGAKSS